MWAKRRKQQGGAGSAAPGLGAREDDGRERFVKSWKTPVGCPEEWAQARHKNGHDVMGQLHLALIPANVWALLSDCCPLSLAGAALPGGQT